MSPKLNKLLDDLNKDDLLELLTDINLNYKHCRVTQINPPRIEYHIDFNNCCFIFDEQGNQIKRKKYN